MSGPTLRRAPKSGHGNADRPDTRTPANPAALAALFAAWNARQRRSRDAYLRLVDSQRRYGRRSP